MRKNTKAILVFLCALVMVLTGISVPKAHAAAIAAGDLTVDYIFDSLGDAVNYGIVAKTWHQEKHAESNACVDILDKIDIGNGFANSNNTYAHITVSSVAASITSPNSLAGMTFALFKETSAGYTLCTGTEQTVESGNSAELTWKLDPALYNQQLHVFLKSGENGYVPDNGVSKGLVVNYGPAVFVGAANGNYLGKILLDQGYDTGKEINVFNTTEYFPSIVLGPETNLYVLNSKNEPVLLDWDAEPSAQAQMVYVNYYYIDKETNTEKMGHAKLNGLYYKNGQFMKNTDNNSGIVHISKIDANKPGYAAALVDNSKTLSAQLANMGGGTIDPAKGTTPNSAGSSTVTGPVDGNGNVVSVYDVEVGEDWLLKWSDDLGVDALPVADNEYVIVNVICPSSGVDASGKRTGILKMGTDAGDLNYFIEGKAGKVQCGWGADAADRGASQRVIYNIVYADENGILQPYQGTIYPHSCHGGTIIAPEAYLETDREVHNGAMIVEEVRNDSQELHGRMLAQKERSTWVRMGAGFLTLEKASIGHDGRSWKDMSKNVDLSGAVFGVYSNKSCSEDSLVTTMTTNAEGKVTSERISAGTYWVKEITPLKDHELNPAVVEVKVVAGEITKVKQEKLQGVTIKDKFINQQNNGSVDLRLVKNNDLGQLLPGAEFGLYTDCEYGYWGPYCTGLIASVKTNHNGVAVFENVPLRYDGVTYYIQEITAPEGHWRNNAVVEVELPASNNQANRDKLITVDGNGNAEGVAFVNYIIRGHIALKKQDAATKAVLPGAEFTIYSDAALTKDAGKMTTGFLPYDMNGEYYGAVATKRDLLPGTYYVVETKAPEGYLLPYEMKDGNKLPKVYKVEVLPDKMVDVVTGNELKSSWMGMWEIPAESFATPIDNTRVITIAGQKKWYDEGFSGSRPQQVTIELYKKVTGATQDAWINETTVSGPDWKFEFKTDLSGAELPLCDKNGDKIEYIVKEKRNGLDNYYSFVKQEEDENGNIAATVANTIKTTKIVGSKKWEDTLTSEHPEKITFLLFAKMDDELIPINYSYGGQMKVEGQRGENYRFSFEGLPTYDINGELVTYVVLEEDSDNYHVVKIESDSETVGSQTTVTMTLTNRLTVPMKGTKTWEDGNRKDRPEVVLEVQQNDETMSLTGEDAVPGVEVIWDKESDPNVWSWKIVGLPKYDEAGNKYTYSVKEGPMAGYTQKVTTDDNGIHFTNTMEGKRVSVTLPVTKELKTANEFIYLPYEFSETFAFGIEADEATTKASGWEIVKDTVEIEFNNTGSKADAFSIEFTQKGTYTFEVKETTPGTGYVKADKTVYTVVYTVTEDSGKLTATPTIKKGNETADEVAFVNTYGSFSISGEKVWQNADSDYRLNIDAGTFKKDYLRIYLYGEENPITDAQMEAWGASLEVNDDLAYDAETGGEIPTGNFVWNYYDLPAYDDDGNALTYVVKELTVKGYQTFYVNNTGTGAQPDGIYEEAPRPAVMDRTYSIYNILADATLRIDKTVEVQGNAQPDTLPEFQFTITPAEGLTGYHFVDAQGKELTSPVTIAVEKKADGKITGTLPVTILFDSFDGTEKKFAFTVKETGTAPAGWTYDDSEKTVTFTVMRNQSAFEPSDSPTISQPVVVAVDPTSGGTASFTNTYKEVEKTSVTVKKVWHTAGGEIAPAEKQYDVTEFLELYVLTTDSDGNEKLTLVKDADGKALRPVQQPLLKGEGTYDYTWSDLPKLKDGEQYVVKEDLEALYAKHPGYYANYDYNRDDYANAEEGYFVSNHVFRANVELAARKLVDGKMPELAKRFSFVVKNLTTNEEHIFKNEDLFVGEDNSLIDVFIVYGPEVQPAPGKTTVYEYVMYEVDPKDGVYIYDKAQFKFQATIDFNGNTTIKVWNEEKQAYVDDLASDAPAFTFDNKTATPVVITKFWMDENGYVKAENAPNIADKLILCKLVNGEPKPVENAELPEYIFGEGELGGVYTWSGLPKYDENGNEIEYVVVEQKMDGYEQNYFGADGRLIDGGTYAPHLGSIENEKVEEKVETTDVIITKVWVGGSLVDSDISNDLVLYANGEHANKAPEKDGNRYAWYDLPKYDENGKLITYTVKESGIPGYVVSYEPLHVGKDADQEVAKDFAFAGETITNTYYQTKGKVEFEGVKVLNGRDMKAGEFTFILTDVHGNEIQRVTNAADGSFTFDAIEFTAEDVPYGESLPAIYRIYEAEGDLPGMTYDPTEYVIELLLTDNKAGKIIVEPVGGSLPEIKFVNTYEEKVYEAKGEVEFDGVKVLNGRDMKAGEFTFILTDKAGKELQRVTNAADGTFAFEPIKYTEKDVPYGKDAEFTYYITELAGNLPGVTYDTTKYEIVVGLWDDAKGTIHVGDISECVNEIVFTNTYEAEGSVTFKGAKFLLGREFKQGDEFTFELLNEKGDVIDTVTINPTSGTKADFAFKTIKYELADAGKTYTYTYRVKEKAGTEEGMTYDDTVHTVTVKVSDAGNGTLKVEASKNADALNFTNTYLAEGTVLFSGTKTMNGKALEGKDFTFVLTDADGKEIETVTNDKDGKIVFSAIQYKLEDAGRTFTYKVSEKNDGKKSVTYDDTVYTVTVKVEDAGNGHLKVTASDNATKLNFTNSYEAKAVLTMNAYKTVNGYKPSVNQVYDFVLLCDDGTEMKAQNKDEVITFGTIGFDEEDVGKTFIYTVKETTEANELLEVDAAIYQVAVTVVDNGDGNLKLETEILKDGKRANGVVFANTATATLAISKTVKGPGPDKAFDLKVTFIGVDGKELEGVYDYDGDVKGTITSGGVIALKDGQSVTIVGLHEGATYTVEENAGPAYTVTVNGKPIAKAEGTLVGHGKLEFINTVEVTTFSVTKVWEGTDLGEITLTLYADGKQITPQPEVTREGDKYTYYNLPKYNEEGEEIVYSAKERGIDGYIRIYNNVEPYQKVTGFVHDGGTIINREIEEEVHELSFKIHKVWTGVEATEEIPAITLTLYCNGEKLDVPTPKPDSEGWYRYYDLPKTVNGQIAVYTVVEEPIPGYTVTYKTASGEVVEEGVNGGEIINAKIPQTGDPATLGLWLALMGASAVLLTMLQRRRKA